MRTSYAMMTSSETPPTEDKGAKVDGVVKAGGATVQGYLGLSCAVLHRTIATTMAHMKEKCGDLG